MNVNIDFNKVMVTFEEEIIKTGISSINNPNEKKV